MPAPPSLHPPSGESFLFYLFPLSLFIFFSSLPTPCKRPKVAAEQRKKTFVLTMPMELTQSRIQKIWLPNDNRPALPRRCEYGHGDGGGCWGAVVASQPWDGSSPASLLRDAAGWGEPWRCRRIPFIFTYGVQYAVASLSPVLCNAAFAVLYVLPVRCDVSMPPLFAGP